MPTSKIPATSVTKDFKTCENCAYNLLARREHSQLELKRKLLAKKFPDTDIANIIEKLCGSGLQSDQRFAESYVHMRVKRGYGPVRLRLELHERGITDNLIDQVLEPYTNEWTVIAEKARHKKFGGGKVIKYSAEQQKQMQFLLYRGFSKEQINAINLLLK